MSLNRLDVENLFQLLRLGHLRLRDGVAEFEECLTQVAELSVNLVAIPKRNDVLARGLDFDSVEFRHGEFSRSFDLVDPRCGNSFCLLLHCSNRHRYHHPLTSERSRRWVSAASRTDATVIAAIPMR